MKIVISASRRTDIPAFYMDWFMDRISCGSFDVINPYNRKVKQVPATSDRVHTIVFWSKNFQPFITGRYGERLEKAGYHLFFNFTLNSECAELEPRVPPLMDRLDQLSYICEHFNAGAVNWRFDPVCFYRTQEGLIHDNLKDFAVIADKASRLGVRRCITSFVDFYPKLERRAKNRPDVTLADVDPQKKVNALTAMARTLGAGNISLQTCCEKEILRKLPEHIGVQQSACIPNDLMMELYGGELSTKADAGQRIKAGCGCKESIDIGSYDLQPCYHNCFFCYANPSRELPKAMGNKI